MYVLNNKKLISEKKEVEVMKKFMAVVLSLMIIGSVLPFSFSAYAAEDDAAPATPAQQATENVTAAQATDMTQATEATEATEATQATETTEPTESTEPTTATQPTTAAVSTEPTSSTYVVPTVAPEVIVPKKVTGFGVSALSNKAVVLKWNLSKDADKYVIQRAVKGADGKLSSYVTVKTTGESTTKYKDTGLKSATVYKYRIYAYHTSYFTTHSTASTVAFLTRPDNVKKVVVKEKGTDTVTLKWSKSAIADKYYVYRSVEGANGKMSAYKLYTKTKKNAVKDNELKSGTIYKFKISVLAKNGKLWSLSKGKAVKTMTKLEAPAKFITKGVSSSKIKLAWSKVNRAQKYELYRTSSSEKEKLIATLKSRKYTDTKISTGADYVYKVRGIRVYKNKKYAGPTVAVSSSAGVKALTELTAKSFMNKALLAWSPVDGAAGYEVYVKRSNGKWDSIATTDNCAYFSNKLTTGKVYKFAVKPYKNVANTKVYGEGKKVAVKAKSGSLYGNTPSGTWVEVSIDAQMLFMYVNNKLYVSTPVVTGNVGDRSTSKGLHHVISRKSPARLRGSYGGSSWDTTVNYWLGFTSDGQGIHDATWRSAFGGSIYKYNGSHGCVNTPLGAVSKVYAKAYVGMPVIVY